MGINPDELNYTKDIRYKQWTKGTDRAELLTKNCSLEEFIKNLVKSFNDLIPHNYIAKKQSQYLKSEKDRLDSTNALILVDFSENYSYVVQDEVQGNYWTRSFCTLHPVTVYIKNEIGETICKSLCLLTDDNTHDVATVFKISKLHYKFLEGKFSFN